MLLRLPNWLGDALMATPVYENLKDLEELILFGPASFVELFEDFPHCKILPFYPRSTKENLQNLRAYQKEKGLLLTNSFSSAWLFFRAGLKERMGFATDARGLLLTRRVSPPPKGMHQRDKYLYLLEKLGYPVVKRELTLYLKEEKLERARNFLKALGVDPDDEKLVLLAPGAAYGPAKKWPDNYYKDIAEKLLSQGLRVLVVGGGKEIQAGNFICQGLKGAVNLCGKTEITTLAGIFALSKALISNDSGLMHLGSALKLPQIAIFGSTDPALTGPLNPRALIIKRYLDCSPCFKRECPKGDYRCLRDISPDEVFQRFLELIA
jgi:heptosyltransferase-2